MNDNLHPIMAQALAPWIPPTEADWIAADLEAARRKNEDPFGERDMHKRIADQNDRLRMEGRL